MVIEHNISDNHQSDGIVEIEESKVSVHELVKTILEAQAEIADRRYKERRKERDRDVGVWVKEADRVPLDSFVGVQGKTITRYSDHFQYAVDLYYQGPYEPCVRQGVFLRLNDDFVPPSSSGNLDDIVPGLTLYYHGDTFDFSFLSSSTVRIKYINSSKGKYVQIGSNELSCLATFGFISIATDNLDPFYSVLVDYIEKLIPFSPGEVDLAGYDEYVVRCEQILGNDNPLTMKRHILLAGPPGCGKSMIMKKVAKNHGEMVRCNLTKTKNWLYWINLFSKVVAMCDRKVLLLIDEIDELGLNRMKNGDSVFELLRLMDGTENTRNLTIMASTNRLEDLDPALLRPGRFGPVIQVLEPEPEQSKAIVDYYAARYGVELDSEAIIYSVDKSLSGAELRLAIEDCIIQNLPITSENVVKNLIKITETSFSFKPYQKKRKNNR
jgi:hypothetical protein